MLSVPVEQEQSEQLRPKLGVCAIGLSWVFFVRGGLSWQSLGLFKKKKNHTQKQTKKDQANKTHGPIPILLSLFCLFKNKAANRK